MPRFKLLRRGKKKPNTTQSCTVCLQMKYLIWLGSKQSCRNLNWEQIHFIFSFFCGLTIIGWGVINANKSMRKAELLANANILSSTQHILSCSMITSDATAMKSRETHLDAHLLCVIPSVLRTVVQEGSIRSKRARYQGTSVTLQTSTAAGVQLCFIWQRT